MSEIKSALELALERTEGVKGDKRSLEMHESKQAGKSLVVKVLDEPGFDVGAKLAEWSGDKAKWAREGFLEALNMNIRLPNEEAEIERILRVKDGLTFVIKDTKRLNSLFEQLDQLLRQYLQNKNDMVERLREQFAGHLRRKEQELAEQTGRQVKMDPAQDPEFAEYLRQNMNHLQSQYAEVLKQVNDEIAKLYQKSPR